MLRPWCRHRQKRTTLISSSAARRRSCCTSRCMSSCRTFSVRGPSLLLSLLMFRRKGILQRAPVRARRTGCSKRLRVCSSGLPHFDNRQLRPQSHRVCSISPSKRPRFQRTHRLPRQPTDLPKLVAVEERLRVQEKADSRASWAGLAVCNRDFQPTERPAHTVKMPDVPRCLVGQRLGCASPSGARMRFESYCLQRQECLTMSCSVNSLCMHTIAVEHLA